MLIITVSISIVALKLNLAKKWTVWVLEKHSILGQCWERHHGLRCNNIYGLFLNLLWVKCGATVPSLWCQMWAGSVHGRLAPHLGCGFPAGWGGGGGGGMISGGAVVQEVRFIWDLGFLLGGLVLGGAMVQEVRLATGIIWWTPSALAFTFV